MKQMPCVILVANDAPPVEKNAASELAAYLRKSTGATFPIRSSVARGKPVIAVGPAAAIQCGALKRPPTGLGPEGFLIRTVGKHLILTGGQGAPRGTLYAVYEFLGSHLGCRWWTPQAELVPKHPALVLPALNKRHKPLFEYRECLYRNVYDARWAARNRTNAFWELSEKWGGHHVYEGWCHTFYSLVPPDPYFKRHPEWFSEVGGKRTCEQAQLCLTNPDLTAFVIDELKRRLRASNPKANYASVSQNDCNGYCQCPNCRALDRKEGGPTGSLIHFVNAVAAGIESEFPDVVIETLAYTYTRKPPRHVRPRPNVSIRLCSYECDFLHPLSHINNRPFGDDLRAWARICDRLYVWDYVTNFENFVQPHPNWYVLGENMRFFRDHHVKGVFEQGNHVSFGGEMAELRAWVLARLLWDPSRDVQALIREFLEGYYGRAAAHIDAYMRLIHGAVTAVEFYRGSYLIERFFATRGWDNPAREGFYLDLAATWDAPFLAPDVVLEALRHFDAAASAVAGDPILSDRVALAKLPVLFVTLVRWPEIRAHARKTRQRWPLPESRTAAFRRFEIVARRHNITQLKEGGSRDVPWLKRVCRTKPVVTP